MNYYVGKRKSWVFRGIVISPHGFRRWQFQLPNGRVVVSRIKQGVRAYIHEALDVDNTEEQTP